MKKLIKVTFIVLRSWLRGRLFPSLRPREVNSLSHAWTMLSGVYCKYVLNLFGLAARSYEINSDTFVWSYFNETWPAPTAKEIHAVNEELKKLGLGEQYPQTLGYTVTSVASLRNSQ
jgi:hypothetical protein